MRLAVLAFLLSFLMLGPAFAQSERDEFLSPSEVSAIREAQEPNQRLKLYVRYARQRLDAIAKLKDSKDEKRGDQIHQNLFEYDRILDAIDKNVDQAEKRRDLFRKGLQYALDAEPEFLKDLEALRAANPEDLEAYKFVLDQAIGDTKDNMDGIADVLKKQPKGRKEEHEYEKDKAREADPRVVAPRNAPVPPNAGQPPPRPTWDPNAGPPRKGQKPAPQSNPGQQP